MGPYGSQTYGNLVWKRPDHILHFLEQDCSVLYTDIDTVWKADPFLDVGSLQPTASQPVELYMAHDHIDPNFFAAICTCLMYLQPTAPVIKLMKKWKHDGGGQHRNQPSFNQAL